MKLSERLVPWASTTLIVLCAVLFGGCRFESKSYVKLPGSSKISPAQFIREHPNGPTIEPAVQGIKCKGNDCQATVSLANLDPVSIKVHLNEVSIPGYKSMESVPLKDVDLNPSEQTWLELKFLKVDPKAKTDLVGAEASWSAEFIEQSS